MTGSAQKITIPAFDGLRGILAVWVLLSHVTQFVDGPRGLVDRGGIAVDMFMFVSGFLMFWTIETRALKESPVQIDTWRKFFIRRFFRIAPLYYCALILALSFGPEWKEALKNIYLHQGHGFFRPFEECARDGVIDVLSHITFLFGLHPCYSASTVIPDWSLSLEMQFYVCFPILFLLLRRVPALMFALIAAAIVGAASHFVGVYLIDPSKLISFPQPSLLALRLNCFVGGMLLARIVCSVKVRWSDLLALAVAIFAFQRATFGVIAVIVSLMVLRPFFPTAGVWVLLNKAMGVLSKLFEGRFGRILGDLSYSVYLLHIFILIPLVAGLQSTTWFDGLSGIGRFLTVVAIMLPLVLLISKVTFSLVEQPFVAIGRRFSK